MSHDLRLLRDRLDQRFRTEIAAMARYFGDHYIDARDVVDDVLIRVLDDVVATEPIFQAEQAALDEILALKRAAVSPPPPPEVKAFGLPWALGELDRNDQRQILGAGGELIATLHHECLGSREPEMEANARFIVAAANAAPAPAEPSVTLAGLTAKDKGISMNNTAQTDNASMDDAAEMLWIVLANVSGGDWTKQTPDWQEAAARWRDNYFAALAASRQGQNG